MATVNASQILSSRASCAYCEGSSADSEPRTFQNQTIPCSKAQASTFHDLRSANRVDELQTRAAAKAKQVTRKVSRNATRISASSDYCGSDMNIVVVSVECAPWSKTGGLGDVVGGLPPALASRCNRVMTVCPRYDQYKDGWDTSVLAELKVGNNLYTVRFFHCYKRSVDRVFIDHPIFLEMVWGETKGKLYGPIAGEDYLDNQLRFAILSMAALEAPRILNLESGSNSGPYGEDVVFVCNDWHTALLPCYLKSMYKAHGIYKNAKVAFCIHNMAYQGRFGFSDFQYLGLPNSFKPSFDFMDGYNKPVKGRKINWMKVALLNSDIALTVIPYYALELVANEATCVELDDVCRKVGLKGIINGIDTAEWNPTTDKYIPVKYEASTVKEAKAIIKEALQAEVGLPIDPSVPFIGFIGRLEEQKGSDILVEAIPEMTEENIQIVALGTGKKSFEKQLQQLEERFPDKARGVAKFNVPLAHLIIAGADYILIPSRFEPCGLIQLQAMCYGTLPICSSTGGLVNTVIEGVTGFHMGAFHIDCESVDPQDVVVVVANNKRAIAEYGTPTYDEMVQNYVALDLSWKGPARIWEETLLGLGVPGSEPGIEAVEVAPLAKENVVVP